MVGVVAEWKARACKSCKQRRQPVRAEAAPGAREAGGERWRVMLTPRQCDYRHPCCARCKRAGFQCVYEARHHAFSTKASPHDSRNSSPASTVLALPENMSNAALRTACLDAAWLGIRPAGGTILSHIWMPANSGSLAGNTALHDALSALSFGSLGQKKSDQTLTWHSHRAYHTALVRVNATLSSPSNTPDEELIGTVLTLATYEMLYGGSPLQRFQGALAHVRGSAGLVQAAGTPAASSPTVQSMLRAIRIFSVLESLAGRQPGLLSDPKYGPSSPGRNSLDDLLDITADIPNTMQRLDRLKALPVEQVSTDDFEATCQELESTIDRLKYLHAIAAPHSNFTFKPSRLVKLLPPSESPARRHYHSVEASEFETIYAIVQVAAHIERLQQEHFGSILRATGTTDSIHRVDTERIAHDMQDYAQAVLQSFEYYVNDKVGPVTVSAALFTVRALGPVFEVVEGPQKEYVHAILAECEKRCSFAPV